MRTARRVQKRVEMIFGRVVKISEITEDQVDLAQLGCYGYERFGN